ncbi:MAG: hypothetical protein JNN15_16605 [Blastocatellia bacterium]|nr:hypothetical protein [Blastocatellia bacterium]
MYQIKSIQKSSPIFSMGDAISKIRSRHVNKLCLKEESIKTFSVQTLNSSYRFEHYGIHSTGNSTWMIVEGRERFIGMVVCLFGLESTTVDQIVEGGRLAMFPCSGDDDWPIYTSEIQTILIDS